MDEQPSSRQSPLSPGGQSPLSLGDGEVGETADPQARESGDVRDDEIQDEFEEAPLARVRYGLGKELRLYPDAFTVLLGEEHEELRYALANITRLVLVPGEHSPSKLVLMFELDDGNTVIAAEGVSNVRGFRRLLHALADLHLPIELDPPDMDEQLKQALEIRSRYQIGCYGLVLGSCLLLTIAYLIIALIGAHHH